MNVTLCDPYFYEDPSGFLKNAWWKSVQCAQKRSPCASELVNQIVFSYIFILIAGSLCAVFLDYWLAIPISLMFGSFYLIPAFRALQIATQFGNPALSKIENFTGSVPVGVQDKAPDSPSPFTYPTAKNPFMNVLIDEIKYNPTRPAAAPINDPQVEGSLDDVFRVQFTSDPTDVFGKTQSQREFVAMPYTTVPNDQGSFADWLYKIPGKTCKEGGRSACLPGTDGSPVTWLNADR